MVSIAYLTAAQKLRHFGETFFLARIADVGYNPFLDGQ
jgi:hypothetical protein